MDQPTSTPSIDDLITRAIKETFEHYRWFELPAVQDVLLPLKHLGNPALVTHIIRELTAPHGPGRLLAFLQQVPPRALLAMDQELPHIVDERNRLAPVIDGARFETYWPETKAQLRAELFAWEQEATSIMAPILEVWERLPDQNPLIKLLDPWPPKRVAQLQTETVLMALLSEHFKQYTGRFHYKEIANAVTILFPRQVRIRKRKRILNEGSHVDDAQHAIELTARIFTAEQVRDRIRKFRDTCDTNADLTTCWRTLKNKFRE